MRRFGIAGHCRLGGGDHLLEEPRFVQVRGVSHLPSEQFDLQVAVPQRQEIGRQVRVDRRARARRAGPMPPAADLLAIDSRQETLPPHWRLAAAKPVGIIVALTAGATIKRPSRRSGGLSARRHLGPLPAAASRARVPERGPRRQQAGGIRPLVVQGEVLQAVAGEQQVQFAIGHVRVNCMGDAGGGESSTISTELRGCRESLVAAAAYSGGAWEGKIIDSRGTTLVQ